MIFSIGLTDLQQFLSRILKINWEHALVSSLGGDDSHISLDKGLMTYVLQVENVRMLDRYNTRKPSVGTLYLTATHLIFVDPDGKKETWVCTIECHCYGVCQIVNYHDWNEFYWTQFTDKLNGYTVHQWHQTLYFPTNALNVKNVELLKQFKIKEAAPTCFGLQGNHHQGTTAST